MSLPNAPRVSVPDLLRAFAKYSDPLSFDDEITYAVIREIMQMCGEHLDNTLAVEIIEYLAGEV